MDRNHPIIVAAIGAVAVIVAAIIGVIANRPLSNPPNPGSLIPDPTSIPTTPVPAPQGVTIIAPKPDQSVSSSEGVIVEGTVAGLGNDTLWLFDLSIEDDKKVYYRDSDEPLAIIDGRWQFVNMPIGSPGPDTELLTITVIRANAECDRVIRGLKQTADGSTILDYPLPSGCNMAAEVRVIKNRA